MPGRNFKKFFRLMLPALLPLMPAGNARAVDFDGVENPASHSEFLIPHSAIPIPYSEFPAPHSGLAVLHSEIRIPRSEFPTPRSAIEISPLAQLLDAIPEAIGQGKRPVIITDLDDTLFDTRHRRLEVLTDFLNQREIQSAYPDEVIALKPMMAVSRMTDSLTKIAKNAGVENEQFLDKLGNFSKSHFMSNDYLSRDTATAGAANYMESAFKSGAVIVYLTARPGHMRPGTLNALRENGFPTPDKKKVYLFTNDSRQNTVIYKDEVLKKVNGFGTVIGGFENEPPNINLFKSRYPDGIMIFVNISGFPKHGVMEGIPTVRNFILPD